MSKPERIPPDTTLDNIDRALLDWTRIKTSYNITDETIAEGKIILQQAKDEKNGKGKAQEAQGKD